MPRQPHVPETLGFHWGKRIAIVYVLFALGTITFVVFAFTQSVDLVRDDYYEASLVYDKSMAAKHNADVLGTAASVHVTDQGAVVLTIPFATVRNATVYCYRPDNPNMDIRRAFVHQQGTQTLPAGTLAPGQWTVKLSWTHAGTPYELERTITVWSTSQH